MSVSKFLCSFHGTDLPFIIYKNLLSISQIHVKTRNAFSTQHALRAKTTKVIVYVPNVQISLWNIFVLVMERRIPMNVRQGGQHA